MAIRHGELPGPAVFRQRRRVSTIVLIPMVVLPVSWLVIAVVAQTGEAVFAALLALFVIADIWVWLLDTREVAIGNDWIAWQNVIRRGSWLVYEPGEIEVGTVTQNAVQLRARRGGSSTTVGHHIGLSAPGSRAAVARLLGAAAPPELS